MSLPDVELLELHVLCNALADGSITPDEHARLSAMLRGSEEARRFYVRSMALSASLFQYAGEMLGEAPDAPAPTALRRIIRHPAFWRVAGPLAAAALLLAAFLLGGNQFRHPRGESAPAEAETEENVAHLSGAKDCRWTGAPLQLGDDLREGRQLDLAEGVAEITFDSGAQVVLEGPASLEITSAWNAVLHRGTLKATVPPQAIGFRIANPAVEVVDLGTEFSMVADETGGTEVFVLKGSVEATSHDGAEEGKAPLVLREKQARRFARSGVSEVGDRERKLVRLGRKLALDRAVRPLAYAHWSFDELGGATLPAQTYGLPPGSYEARFTGAGASAATVTDGRWHGALKLDGSVSLTAPFPEISKRSARTVAFWMRLAPDTDLSTAGPMLAWTLGGSEIHPVEIGWNRNPAQGAFGALQTRFARRVLVGASPLRDGRWHHLAVVFAQHGRNENAIQVKQYVDGRLEGVTAKYAMKRRGPATGRAADGDLAVDLLSIGGLGGAHGNFRGDLDELFICDRALAPREIAQLVQNNQPLVPEMFAAD